MSDDQPDTQILRLSPIRKREILFAVAWRGILYSFFALIGVGCFTYLFANGAWQFFLNPALELNKDEAAVLYLCLALPCICIGWVLAVSHTLHRRFSHFRIALSAEPRRFSWFAKLIAGTDREKRRKY